MAGVYMIHTAGARCPWEVTFFRKVDFKKKNQGQQLNYSSRQTADHKQSPFLVKYGWMPFMDSRGKEDANKSCGQLKEDGKQRGRLRYTQASHKQSFLSQASARKL